MKVDLPIQGAYLVTGKRHEDNRGSFQETFHVDQFEQLGLPTQWAQDNVSFSFYGVLRGMHLQQKNPQGKLVRCLMGAVFDAIVDLRPESPTFKKSFGTLLLSSEPAALYVPPGCAHGFYCVSDASIVQYKCTTMYDKESDSGVHWAKCGIDWPFDSLHSITISPKDQLLPGIDDYINGLG